MSEKKPGTSGRKNMILNVVMIVCIAAILVCGLQITRSLIEYKKAKDKNDGLSDIMSGLLESTTIATTIQTSTTAPVSTETSVGETEDTSVTETTKPEPIPREQYREIYTQLTTMKAQYPELYGWIHIEFDEKHVINLPVMQSEDNNMYYIDHAYDGTESMAGAIFADYRNTARRLDFNQNLILYGHHMNNGTMFAYVSSQYKIREKFDSASIVVYSLDGVYTFNAFAVYNAKAGDDFDRIGFADGSLKEYCIAKQRKSYFSKNLTFDDVDTIVTLVTCTNFGSDGRVIVHGVLESYDPFFD